MEVKNNQNEKLGKVNDWRGCGVGTDCLRNPVHWWFIGIGDTLHAVPRERCITMSPAKPFNWMRTRRN